jgi:hypothetical protein
MRGHKSGTILGATPHHRLDWGLIDRPIRIATIPDSSSVDLRTGYILLTGRPPLHGYTDLCAEAA